MPTKILVVDDEPDLELLIQQKFRRAIRDGDLVFSFARDGLEALERVEAEPDVDLVLTDINMPRMDGLTLLGRLQETERVLKVVIVSAYGDMANIRTAMNRGAFDFVTKPIDFADLEATIGKTRRALASLKEAAALALRLSAIERELEVARRIQMSALPARFPAFPERDDVDLFATMQPAREVGGDFYDFFLLDDDHLGFALGDVAGKGVGAALFMAITRTMLRATALGRLPVDACVSHVNRVLHPESLARMFVTLIYGVLDLATGRLVYCDAGHHPPLVRRCDGTVSPLARTGGPGLCLTPDFVYEARRTLLHPGDTLLLFSDGVTEAADAMRSRFTEQGLSTCLRAADGAAPAALVRHVLDAVETFSGDAPQEDDVTLLALQYLGTGSK